MEKTGVKYQNRYRIKFDFVILMLFAIVIPISEAAKNVTLGLLILTWAYGIFRRDVPLDFSPKSIVVPFFLWQLITLVPLITSDWSISRDFVQDVSGALKVALVIMACTALLTTKDHFHRFLVAVSAGGIISVAEAYFAWWGSGQAYPELRSVGHVNHSALYVAVLIICSIGLILFEGLSTKILGVASGFLGLSILIPMKSLTAYIVVAGYLVLSIFFAVKTRKKNLFVGLMVVYAAVGGAFIVYPPPQISDEIHDLLYNDEASLSSYRWELFNTAYYAVQKDLFFGAGVGQFKKASDKERVEKIVENLGEDWKSVSPNLFFSNHGHGLYTNVLVERGLLGLVVLLIFMGATAKIIFRHFYSLSEDSNSRCHVSLIFIGSSTWFLIFIGGFGNTTLHNEHGLVAAIILIACLKILERDFRYN